MNNKRKKIKNEIKNKVRYPVKIKRILLLTLILSLICYITIISTIFLYSYINIVDIYYIPLAGKIGENIGLNSNVDMINFGRVTKGGSSTRTITISNDEIFPVKIIIQNKGMISSYVSTSDNDIVLDTDKSIKIEYFFTANDNLPFGNYTGISKIIIKRKWI